jgi:hypothetical protein
MRTPRLAISFTREAGLMIRGSCSCLQAAEQPGKLADEHSTSHTGPPHRLELREFPATDWPIKSFALTFPGAKQGPREIRFHVTSAVTRKLAGYGDPPSSIR